MASLPASLQSTSDMVLIANPERLRDKIARIQAAGSSALHVVADFDYTLTKFGLANGERAMSTHRVIEASPILGKDFQDRSKELFKTYYPIEISDMPKQEKFPHMVDWWTKAHDAILEHSLYKRDLAEMVRTPDIVMRDRAADLFALAQTFGVPFHIFSAGLYDVIHAFLIEKDLCQYHVHVVSNMMVFDESGKATAFKGEVIHSLNKTAEVLKTSPHFALIENRPNVLLLGDNLTDINMSDGLAVDTVLSVGFLNDRVEDRKREYMDTFDVVLLGDQDLSLAHDILQTLLSTSSKPDTVETGNNSSSCEDS